jgi:hypothetical protein
MGSTAIRGTHTATHAERRGVGLACSRRSWCVGLVGIALTGLVVVQPHRWAPALSDAPRSTVTHRTVTPVPEVRSGLAAYRRLPLAFAQNLGLTDSRVRYLSRGAGSSIYFSKRRVTLALMRPAVADHGSGVAVQLRFAGASPRVRLAAGGSGQGRLNSLVGKRAEWRSGVPTFGRLAYREVWPGVDVVFRGVDGVLREEFRVRPGADVHAIRLAFVGADHIALGPRGRLLVETAAGSLVGTRPVAYQRVGGRRVAIESRYARRDSGGYGIAVGSGTRNGRRPLVIDSALVYSTFVGGASNDEGHGIAVDQDGAAYITGLTASPDYPTTPGAFRPTYNGGNADVFVTKLNPSGTGIVYSTFLGGSDSDSANGIAVDAGGHAYVTGATVSADYPTTPGAYDTTPNGDFDVFVTKLDPSGSALAYSTLLGGTGFETAASVAVDEGGRAYVTGSAGAGYPVTAGAFDSTADGGDAFVTELDATGSSLAYSTFLGGTNFESGDGIAVDSQHSAYATGFTHSSDYPTTPGAFDRTSSDGEAFVTKVEPSGAGLIYSTYLGGSDLESPNGIVVDGKRRAYITGITHSADFPTTAGVFDRTFNDSPSAEGGDAFVTRLAASGSTLSYSTFLGSPSFDTAFGIAVDRDARAFVTGFTGSRRFPTTPRAFDRHYNGGVADAFVTALDPSGGALAYSTFLGGSDFDQGLGIAVDGQGQPLVTGYTLSLNYPATRGTVDRTFNGEEDAFATKLTAPGR